MAYLMVRVTAPDLPPPGTGFRTVICAVPGVPISDAGISATNFELVTHFVVRLEPFHKTAAPWTKLEPLTVSRKFGPCEVTVAGLTDLATGRGVGPFDG